MCFGRVTQRHPATNRQNELAIPHVIGKLAHLGWIWLRKHARNLHSGFSTAALSGKTEVSSQRSRSALPSRSASLQPHLERRPQLHPLAARGRTEFQKRSA